MAPRRPPRLQLRHQVSARGEPAAPRRATLRWVLRRGDAALLSSQGQLDRGGALQGGEAVLSLPALLRRGLLQQHVLHGTQIQPSGLAVGLRQRSTPPLPHHPLGTGEKRIIYNTTLLLALRPSSLCCVRQDIKPISAPLLPPFLDTLWGYCLFQLLRAGGRWGQLVVAWGTWGERGWLSWPCCVGLGALPATPGLGRGCAVISQTVPLG